MAHLPDRITPQPLLASAASVVGACFGGALGFAWTAYLQIGAPVNTDGIMAGAVGLVFLGVLVGGLPALGVLLVFVWPSLLILNRVLKLKPRVSVSLTWLIGMGAMAIAAVILPEGALPMWRYLLTPMVGLSLGALVLAGFASGSPAVELDIPWRRD